MLKMSIQYSNPWSLEHEPSPITTRPGAPSFSCLDQKYFPSMEIEPDVICLWSSDKGTRLFRWSKESLLFWYCLKRTKTYESVRLLYLNGLLLWMDYYGGLCQWTSVPFSLTLEGTALKVNSATALGTIKYLFVFKASLISFCALPSSGKLKGQSHNILKKLSLRLSSYLIAVRDKPIQAHDFRPKRRWRLASSPRHPAWPKCNELHAPWSCRCTACRRKESKIDTY